MKSTDILGITPEEAFRRIGVSRALGYKLIKNRTIPAIRLGERRYVVPVAALEKLLEVAEADQAASNA